MTERYTTTIENPEEVSLGKYQMLRALSVDEYESLKERIAISGIEETIKVDSDFNVIDGHHRITAWVDLLNENRSLPKKPQVLVMADLETEAQKFEKAYELNAPGRQLEVADKIQIARDLLEKYPQWSDKRIAPLAGVADRTVARHRERLERMGRIQPQTQRLGVDGRVRGIENTRNGSEDSTATPVAVESSKKTLKEEVEEQLTENPEATDREISEQTGAATWFVSGIREQLGRLGVVPAPPSHRPPVPAMGALEVLGNAGIELPPPPVGKTHEERVKDTLWHFFDQMRSMPSDPEAVAQSLKNTPLEATARLEDADEAYAYLGKFRRKLRAVAETSGVALSPTSRV